MGVVHPKAVDGAALVAPDFERDQSVIRSEKRARIGGGARPGTRFG
jgi:hypothetical protein